MAISVNVKPPPLNRAAFELIQAVERVEDLGSFRLVLLTIVRLAQESNSAEVLATPHMRQVLEVWLALDALADAVDARRDAE